MKKTVPLTVAVSQYVERTHMVMHPNEGFDLGLMRVSHPVRLCRGLGLESYLKGEEGEVEMLTLDLLNECPPRTILVGLALYKALEEPPKAVVLYDGTRLYVHRQVR